ncbi:MAG: MFS transporter [Candidatus Saccharibacteria bacterium]
MSQRIKEHSHRTGDLYVLTALAKGFPVFCSVLLPVLYAEKLISAQLLGFIGALFITMTIMGAIVVAKWLHGLDTRRLLQFAAFGTIGASSILFVAVANQNIPLLMFAYGIMGLAAGTALSAVNAMVANMSTRGNRFKIIAQLSMVADVVRILFSLAVAGLVMVGLAKIAVLLIVCTAFLFLFYASRQEKTTEARPLQLAKAKSMKHNKAFKFILSLEFLDSFSSSQLFVFLPLLFLAKGYSLQNSILLQAFTFLGYMAGRWLVGVLARYYSGLKAVELAETGQVLTILLLLTANSLWVLYALCIALGIFARGTSPAIKSLAFDSLDDEQMKQGSALHVIAGDSGSALGQLTFGLLVASFGAKAPFIVAASVASLISVLCLPKLGKPFMTTSADSVPIPAEAV